jgi:hypothetical protein
MIVLDLWHALLRMPEFYFERLRMARMVNERVYVGVGTVQANCLNFDWGYLGNFSLR